MHSSGKQYEELLFLNFFYLFHENNNVSNVSIETYILINVSKIKYQYSTHM